MTSAGVDDDDADEVRDDKLAAELRMPLVAEEETAVAAELNAFVIDVPIMLVAVATFGL